MDACTIPYIPERLHSNNKPDVPVFSIGELLFRRCPHSKIEDPFDSITLSDLSVNREGKKENPLSLREDVLYNLNPKDNASEMLDESIIDLEIKEILAEGTFAKTITKNGIDGNGNFITHECQIELLHHKLPCNYSHCIFKISLNGTEVTFDNYKNTLGRKGVSELRTCCKLEFEKMIRYRELRINWNNKSEKQ